MSQETIKILIVDDHPLLRKGVIQLLQSEDNFKIVGEARNGEAAMRLALDLEPDLVLLDLNMKGMNGIETLKALKQADVAAKIVIFTVSDSETDVLGALKANADGYILKDSEPEELIEHINTAMQGDIVISQTLNPILAKALRPEMTHKSILDKLTNREQQIFQYISQGDSNKVIANKLNIAESTVKVHVKHLLKKIKLRTRIEAALYAVENKLF